MDSSEGANNFTPQTTCCAAERVSPAQIGVHGTVAAVVGVTELLVHQDPDPVLIQHLIGRAPVSRAQEGVGRVPARVLQQDEVSARVLIHKLGYIVDLVEDDDPTVVQARVQLNLTPGVFTFQLPIGLLAGKLASFLWALIEITGAHSVDYCGFLLFVQNARLYLHFRLLLCLYKTLVLWLLLLDCLEQLRTVARPALGLVPMVVVLMVVVMQSM